MSHSERIRDALDRFDARATHERVLLLLGAIAGAIVLWQAVLMEPVTRERAAAANDLPALASEIDALNQRVTQLEASLREDPDAPAWERRAALEAERKALGERLAELTSGLVPPDEMASALRELLRRESGLELVRLEALPAEPLLVASDEAPNDGARRPAVFKHPIAIELRGEYLAVLHYVRTIEDMHWKFFWDSIDYEVDGHPTGRVRLKLYSLSLREGWLGV
jgi:MSHA biogenesis protein MshJ